MEAGKLPEAVKLYRKAYALLPSSPILQESLAQAMLEASPSPQEVDEIISLLKKALVKRANSYTWLMLARAYGMKGDEAYANYASAEFSFRIRSFKTAEKQIKAARKAKPSTALSLKLDDLEKRVKKELAEMEPERRR